MRVLISNDGIITARIVFGHSPHRPARSLRSRAGVRFPNKGSIRITGAPLYFYAISITTRSLRGNNRSRRCRGPSKESQARLATTKRLNERKPTILKRPERRFKTPRQTRWRPYTNHSIKSLLGINQNLYPIQPTHVGESQKRNKPYNERGEPNICATSHPTCT